MALNDLFSSRVTAVLSKTFFFSFYQFAVCIYGHTPVEETFVPEIRAMIDSLVITT